MEYIIEETTANQYAWLLGAVLLKPTIKLILKVWKINKRLHIISYGDTRIDEYDDDYED